MRQSAAFLALGLGLLFPCLAVQFGHASGWDAVSLWAGIGFGLGFSIPAALDGALAVGERLADLRKANALTRELELRNAGRMGMAAYAPQPPAPMVLRRIRINDRTGQREIDMPESRPPRWVAWQSCIEAALQWAHARSGITSGLMVGPSAMFRDRGDWVVVTGVMAGAGLLEKANGRAAQLTDDSGALLARVREGQCEWPTDRQPPAYSPAPVSVGAELAEAN